MNIILSSLLNSILMWFGFVRSYDSAVLVQWNESVDSFNCDTNDSQNLIPNNFKLTINSKTQYIIHPFHLGILSNVIALL